MAGIELFRAGSDFQQVVAELGPDRTLQGIHVGAEHDPIELRHHHARAETAQVSALGPGRAGRLFPGDRSKVFSRLDSILEFQAFFFR